MMQTAPAARGGLFEDLIEVLYAPGAVFERTRTTKATMYLIVTAVLVAVIAFSTKNLLTPWLDAQADVAIKVAAAKGTPVPEAAANTMRTFTGWSIVAGAPLTMIIGPLLNALFILAGAKVMDARITFAQATMVATLAGVPRILGWIALPVQALLLDGSKARSVMDLQLGPARFPDPVTTPAPLLTLLANLDLFRIWQIALIAIGVAVVARVPRMTGLFVALIMLGIGAILQLLPAALT